jgi:hypothetical protein
MLCFANIIHRARDVSRGFGIIVSDQKRIIGLRYEGHVEMWPKSPGQDGNDLGMQYSLNSFCAWRNDGHYATSSTTYLQFYFKSLVDLEGIKFYFRFS